MKRILILLFILLMIISAYFITKDKTSEITIPNDRSFAMQDIGNISFLYIHQEQGGSIKLSKVNDTWYVNDKMRARQNAINNLLEVLQGIRVKYIPPKAAMKNIYRDLNKIGINVQVHDSNGQRIKDYFIGSVTKDERGTYMLMAGYDQPYVMYLPTLEGSFRGRFVLDVNEWRDRTVLKEDLDQIARIDVIYPLQQNESFTLLRERNKFNLKPLGQLQARNPASASQNLIKSYLDGYRLVVAEFIENDNPFRDSLEQKIAFANIKISYKNNKLKELNLFNADDPWGSTMNTQKAIEDQLIDRYFVDCSWGDLMLVQDRLIGKLLKGYNYFFDD